MIETKLLGPRQTLSRSKSLNLAQTRTWLTIITKKMTFCWVRSQTVNRVDLANGKRTPQPERKATQVLTTTLVKSRRSTMKEKLTKWLELAYKSKAFQCRVNIKKAQIIPRFRRKSIKTMEKTLKARKSRQIKASRLHFQETAQARLWPEALAINQAMEVTDLAKLSTNSSIRSSMISSLQKMTLKKNSKSLTDTSTSSQWKR